MSQRRLIWHLGLARSPRPVVAASLAAHAQALRDHGAHVVATPEEARRATHDLLRTHRSEGLGRAEVEGRWAQVCDRVWRHRGVSLLSTPDLCVADKDQIRLALDQLIGIEVHLVVTVDSFSQQLYGGWLAELRAGRSTGWDKYVGRVLAEPREHRQAEEFWAGHELEQVLARWGWTFRPERLHVVAHESLAAQWSAFLAIAGLESAGLAIAGLEAGGLAPVVPAYPDPAGVAVLRRVNRQLEAPVAGSAHLLSHAEDERAALPVADTSSLAPTVARWEEALRAAGHDLRGSLGWLCETGEGTGLPGARDQLDLAVDRLAEVLVENARLRAETSELLADRARLKRKRRKLRAQLAAAVSGARDSSS